METRLIVFLNSELSGGLREYFTVEGKVADMNCTGAWVEPKAGLDALEER